MYTEMSPKAYAGISRGFTEVSPRACPGKRRSSTIVTTTSAPGSSFHSAGRPCYSIPDSSNTIVSVPTSNHGSVALESPQDLSLSHDSRQLPVASRPRPSNQVLTGQGGYSQME